MKSSGSGNGARWPASRRSWLLLWLALLLVGGGWSVVARQRFDPNARIPPRVVAQPGSQAPNFSLQTLDGATLSLSDLRGQPVLINFWASWCGPCRLETPFLQSLHERQQQVAIIGVNQGEGLTAAQTFAEEFALSYPLLLDSDRSVSRTYRVVGLPTTVLIDRNGIIAEVIPGAASEAVFEAALAKLSGD